MFMVLVSKANKDKNIFIEAKLFLLFFFEVKLQNCQILIQYELIHLFFKIKIVFLHK